MLNEKIIVQHFIMIKTAITEKHNIISHFVALPLKETRPFM